MKLSLMFKFCRFSFSEGSPSVFSKFINMSVRDTELSSMLHRGSYKSAHVLLNLLEGTATLIKQVNLKYKPLLNYAICHTIKLE